MTRIHVNNYESRTSAVISAVATSVTFDESIPLTFSLDGNTIKVTLYNGTQEEIIEINDSSTAPIYPIAERGSEGTTARQWGAGTKVQCRFTAASVDELETPPISLIYTGAATAVPNVNITGIGDYSKIQIIITNLIPVTDAAVLQFRTSTNNGTSYDSGATDYTYSSSYHASGAQTGSAASGGVAFLPISDTSGVGNASSESYCGEINIYNPADITSHTHIAWSSVYSWPTGASVRLGGGGTRKAITAVDAVRLYFSTGNIASGRVQVYGYKKV